MVITYNPYVKICENTWILTPQKNKNLPKPTPKPTPQPNPTPTTNRPGIKSMVAHTPCTTNNRGGI